MYPLRYLLALLHRPSAASDVSFLSGAYDLSHKDEVATSGGFFYIYYLDFKFNASFVDIFSPHMQFAEKLFYFIVPVIG